MIKQFKEFGIDTTSSAYVGKRIDIDEVFNTSIKVHKFRIVDSKFPKDKGVNKCLHLQISIDNIFRVIFTISNTLIDQVQQVPSSGFPFETKIVKDNKRFSFS